jgi:hypothetical protein
MRSHDELLVQLLADPGVAAEYEALGEEFAVFDELTRARRQAGLTQAEVISRIEAPDAKHSPSLRTLQKYAQAVGCRLEIRLVQDRVRKPKAI